MPSMAQSAKFACCFVLGGAVCALILYEGQRFRMDGSTGAAGPETVSLHSEPAVIPYPRTGAAETETVSTFRASSNSISTSKQSGYLTATPCSESRYLKLSYSLPPRFPFPPIRLVMESKAGMCNFYKNRNFCKLVSTGLHFEPEWHVTEVIASFLTGCDRETCAAIDLGANQGWMSAYMLSLGAHVISAEPQSDFAKSLRKTVVLNCWTGRSEVITGAVSADPHVTGSLKVKPFRFGGAPFGLKLPAAPFVPLDSIFSKIQASTQQSTIKFIKMDADGPEGSWLERIMQLLSEGKLTIESMVVEASGVTPKIMYGMHQVHGYDTYLLDCHVDRRFLDARGFDVYSHFLPDRDLPDFMEELYSIRFMRHLYHFHANMTLQDWERFYHPHFWRIKKPQFLFTQLNLLEPHHEHTIVARVATANSFPVRKRSGYTPPPDGIGSWKRKPSN